MKTPERANVAEIFSDEPFLFRVLRHISVWVNSLSPRRRFLWYSLFVALGTALGESVFRYFGSNHPNLFAIGSLAILVFAYNFLSHYFARELKEHQPVPISVDNNEVMAGYFEAKNAAKESPRVSL